MCVFHNSDTILLIYLFIHSLYSLIMLTRSENRTLGAAAVAVAADVALAEASLELPPANNPANAALADPSLGSLEVASDNSACLVSVGAGSKEVASLEVPPPPIIMMLVWHWRTPVVERWPHWRSPLIMVLMWRPVVERWHQWRPPPIIMLMRRWIVLD